MMPERRVRRVFCIVFLVCVLLVPPMMTGAVAEKTWRVRHRDFFPWCWMWGVRDSELHVHQTDEKLRVFFAGCQTPVDFYNRIQEHVFDSNREVQYTDLSMLEQRLPVIVDTVMSNETVYLFCHHQALLFAAGVKTVFSEYDDQIGRYVLMQGYGDFSLEIWRSMDFHQPILLYRSHVQIVIDTWNGTTMFTIGNFTADRIEADNWEDQFRVFDRRNDAPFPNLPFILPMKRNSILRSCR